MDKLLTIDKEQNGTMDVRAASNGKLLGCFMVSEDGYYNFWPLENITGYYSSGVLIELGYRLKEINQWWEDNLNEHFKQEQNG